MLNQSISVEGWLNSSIICLIEQNTFLIFVKLKVKEGFKSNVWQIQVV